MNEFSSALKPSRQTSSWISCRIRRQRSTGPGRSEALDGVDRTVERDPREHLRVREVPARPAHLPDPFVGLVPRTFEEVHQVPLQAPRVVLGGHARDVLPRERDWCSASITSP